MTKRMVLVLIIIILLIGCNRQKIEIKKSLVIEKNIYSFNRKYLISRDFDGYFQYKDKNNRKYPVLIHISFKYSNQNKDYDKIFEAINNFKFSLIGIDGDLKTIDSLNTRDSFYNFYRINSQSNKLVESIENEAGVAFLKKNFGDKIIIKNIDDKKIEYEVKERVEDLEFKILFIKDKKDDQIFMKLEN